MCIGSSPAAPAPPEKLPEAPQAPTTPASRGTRGAGDRARRRRVAGETGTILTGPRGIEGPGAPTGAKTLLGQ